MKREAGKYHFCKGILLPVTGEEIRMNMRDRVGVGIAISMIAAGIFLAGVTLGCYLGGA